ncbi:MAG: hypothetical protein CMD26_01455 [Flavobacteriales bacterium]|nr:hypothetical protein [Flavobacteriales bacterium]|tara:strand:- start:17095 stop:17862 length:768 start_codon:yes stop_codon:yes gene_type:complete
MGVLYFVWTFWCFFITFLVYLFFLPLNLVLVFCLGQYGRDIFVRYHHYIGKILLFLYGMIKVVKGHFPISNKQPCIYIANHKSYLDVIIIASLVSQNIKYLGKAEVFKWPLFGFFAKYSGQIPVQREDKQSRNKAYESMKQSLGEGFSIVLFPEGGWRNNGDENYPNPYGYETNSMLNPFRNGAFRLAIETKVPIIPIALLNAGEKFSSKTMRIIPGKLFVYVFDAIHVIGNEDPFKLNKKCYDMICEKLINKVL